MECKLINSSPNDINDITGTVLHNRGVKNPCKYLHLTDDVVYSYKLLDNIDNAVRCFCKVAPEESRKVHIIVDSDVDGYTSSAIMYMYLKTVCPMWEVTYSLHDKKQHGLSEDITIPKDTQLLIIPDAGSNDVEQCCKLKEENALLDIIILDHHIIEIDNPYAIIVNNQKGNYPNKELSGVGITYKFVQALDDEWFNFESEKYLDLVALGNIGDMMDIRSYETKRIIDKGLSSVCNPLFKALIKKQFDSIHNRVNIHNVQFYIVPLINALIRMGSQEEKDLMFQAFIEQTQYFDYKPRNKPAIEESIYDRVARFCNNAKARQRNAINKALSNVYNVINNSSSLNDKVLLVNITHMGIDESLTGIMAMKIAEKYKKPTLCLRKVQEDGLFRGSGRNYKNSSCDNFKELLAKTDTFKLVQGHDNAFGVEIYGKNVKKTIYELNSLPIKNESVILCDFIITADFMDTGVVKRIDDSVDIYGQNIDEPIILVTNLLVKKSQFNLMGKQFNNWRIETDNGVSFVKFGVDNASDALCNLFDDFSDTEEVILNVVGKTNINVFNGIITCQFIVDDYEVVGGDNEQ